MAAGGTTHGASPERGSTSCPNPSRRGGLFRNAAEDDALGRLAHRLGMLVSLDARWVVRFGTHEALVDLLQSAATTMMDDEWDERMQRLRLRSASSVDDRRAVEKELSNAAPPDERGEGPSRKRALEEGADAGEAELCSILASSTVDSATASALLASVQKRRREDKRDYEANLLASKAELVAFALSGLIGQSVQYESTLDALASFPTAIPREDDILAVVVTLLEHLPALPPRRGEISINQPGSYRFRFWCLLNLAKSVLLGESFEHEVGVECVIHDGERARRTGFGLFVKRASSFDTCTLIVPIEMKKRNHGSVEDGTRQVMSYAAMRFLFLLSWAIESNRVTLDTSLTSYGLFTDMNVVVLVRISGNKWQLSFQASPPLPLIDSTSGVRSPGPGLRLLFRMFVAKDSDLGFVEMSEEPCTMDEYRPGALLGVGGFGRVYEVLDHPDLTIKFPRYLRLDEVIRIESNAVRAIVDCPAVEVESRRHLPTSALLKQKEDAFALITGPRGHSVAQLLELIETATGDPIIKGALRLQVAIQVLEGVRKGLRGVHTAGRFHGDVRPDNIVWCFHDDAPSSSSSSSLSSIAPFVEWMSDAGVFATESFSSDVVDLSSSTSDLDSARRAAVRLAERIIVVEGSFSLRWDQLRSSIGSVPPAEIMAIFARARKMSEKREKMRRKSRDSVEKWNAMVVDAVDAEIKHILLRMPAEESRVPSDHAESVGLLMGLEALLHELGAFPTTASASAGPVVEGTERHLGHSEHSKEALLDEVVVREGTVFVNGAEIRRVPGRAVLIDFGVSVKMGKVCNKVHSVPMFTPKRIAELEKAGSSWVPTPQDDLEAAVYSFGGIAFGNRRGLLRILPSVSALSEVGFRESWLQDTPDGQYVAKLLRTITSDPTNLRVFQDEEDVSRAVASARDAQPSGEAGVYGAGDTPSRGRSDVSRHMQSVKPIAPPTEILPPERG